MPGLLEELLVEVGGEDLEFSRARRFPRRFHERHGEGIGLLAGGAAEHPATDRIVPALRQELGQDIALEHIERLGVAKETRDADEHVGEERVEFLGIAPEKALVALQRVLLGENDAPGDAPLDGAGSVERKVDAAMVA